MFELTRVSDVHKSQSPLDLAQIFEPVREDLARVDQEFLKHVQSRVQLIPQIGKYLQTSGGKRIRPATLLMAARMSRGDAIEATELRDLMRIDPRLGTPGPPAMVPNLAPAPAPMPSLPAEVVPNGAGAASEPPAKPGTLREFKEASERAFLVEKLREFGWNISRTAEMLDTPRSNLYKKLEQHQISQEKDG